MARGTVVSLGFELVFFLDAKDVFREEDFPFKNDGFFPFMAKDRLRSDASCFAVRALTKWVKRLNGPYLRPSHTRRT